MSDTALGLFCLTKPPLSKHESRASSEFCLNQRQTRFEKVVVVRGGICSRTTNQITKVIYSWPLENRTRAPPQPDDDGAKQQPFSDTTRYRDKTLIRPNGFEEHDRDGERRGGCLCGVEDSDQELSRLKQLNTCQQIDAARNKPHSRERASRFPQPREVLCMTVLV